jgi:hypothetical protein
MVKNVRLEDIHSTLGTFLGLVGARTEQQGVWVDCFSQGVGVKLHNGVIVGTANLIPAATRSIIFGSNTYICRVPPLVVFSKWHTDGRLSGSAVFVVNPSVPTFANLKSLSRVSHWPWGNVYADGKVCWGSVNTSRMKPTEAHRVGDLFLAAPFNHDLWNDNWSYDDWESDEDNEEHTLDPTNAISRHPVTLNQAVTNYFGAPAA